MTRYRFSAFSTFMFRAFLVAFLLLCSFAMEGQSKLQETVTIDADHPLPDFLKQISANTGLKFYFIQEWLSPYVVSTELNGLPLSAVIHRTLDGSDIQFVQLFDYAVIFLRDPEWTLEHDKMLLAASRKNAVVKKVSFGSREGLQPGQRFNITGVVRDKASGEPLPGVFISVTGVRSSNETNAKGEFYLSVPAGEYFITFNFPNYDEGMLDISAYADGELTVDLSEKAVVLEEIVVSDQGLTTRNIGVTLIKKTELSRAPTFLGSVDIVKSLQVQAGVSAVGEATSGFNVRGGSVDQNLVLYDGVPIFNTSHAMGFYSAFNSDVIENMEFYKGGIPAEFGGRVSSVLSLSSREGNFHKWGGEVSAGPIASSIIVGGPLQKNKRSLVMSLRGSYSDWAINWLRKNYDGIEEASVTFYDGSFKYTEKLSESNKLTISGYASHDRFKLASDTVNQWRNVVLSAQYDHVIRGGLYYKLSASLGQYAYEVREPEKATASRLKYQITYPAVLWELTSDGQHRKSIGIQGTFYNLRPGDLRAASAESNTRRLTMPDENSIEAAVYISDRFQLTEKFDIEAGLRYAHYARIGKALVYQYQPNAPLQPRTTIDSISYIGGEIVKSYGGLEPRISLRYALNDQVFLKVGFNRIHQFVHLVSNTASVTPVDIWQSSNTYFRPQRADQISFGVFTSGRGGVWQASLEGFYKEIDNILDFKDGANLILNPRLETSLLQGIGKSYGSEFSISKTKGRLEFDLNYTWSRSLRKVDSDFESEQINNGNWFPANFDQPHIVNLNWRLKIARKAFFSGMFTYRSGRPVSVPVAAYEINHVPVIDFSERNNFRLQDYHRLDLAFVAEGSNRKSTRIRREWSFSVYNVYARKNPYSAFFAYNVSGSVRPKQIALIGIPVPSISYKIIF